MSILAALSHVALAGFAASSIGHWIAGKRWAWPHPLLRQSFETALGLGVLSHLVLLLIYLHLLTAPVLFGFYALCGLTALFSFFKLHAWLRQTVLHIPFWIFLILAAYFGWIFLAASLPPSSIDEVIYHLEIPKRFLQAGGPFFFKNNFYAYFPQGGEMLFLFGMATAGETAARMYHGLWCLLLGGAVYGFARMYVSRRQAFLTLLLFLTLPSVVMIASWAYVDLAFTLCTLLAVTALLQYQKFRATRWAAAAGLMTGLALCLKYTGLQLTLLLAAWMFWMGLSEKSYPKTKDLLLFAGITVFAALPYLLRNLAETGWPLFPFHLPGLQLRPWMNWDAERTRLYLGWLAQFGTPLGYETVWHTLFAPLFVFIFAKINSIPLYDGILGPVFLLTPAAYRAARGRHPHFKWIGGLSLMFVYYWAFTTKQIRFLLPVMPFLCLILAAGTEKLMAGSFFSAEANPSKQSQKRPGPFLVSVLVTAYLLGHFGLGAWQAVQRKPFDYWRGRETRDAYLSRQLGNYPVYQKVNELLTGQNGQLFLINMKNYGYFLEHPFESDFLFERWRLDQLLKGVPAPDAVTAFFRKLDVTHLLIDEGFVMSPEWGLEGEALAGFQNFIRQKTEPVYRDGPYGLYQLKE